jgi:RimJ/RimL family protein N-acetyltransferase
MNSTEICSNVLTPMQMLDTENKPVPNNPIIRVKELCERDRRCLLMHLLELDDSDRLQRFGMQLSDEAITKYVQKINFSRDSVFGVFDSSFKLVGAGHLAYIPREALPFIANATTKGRTAEFGISVSVSARGMGVGTKLFHRAEIHCRNADVDTLYIHCLSSNQIMMHLADKMAMDIHHDHGEAEVFLKLRSSNSSSMMQEPTDEQIATLDYAMKANTRTAAKWLECFPAFKTF